MATRTFRQGIAEITEQAYARRNGIDEEPPERWWRVKTRIIAMTIISVVVGSLILYWFTSSILENQRGVDRQTFSSQRSSKASYLERLSGNVLPLEYTLKIIPLLEEGNFTAIGDVRIELYCKMPIKHFRLHANGLEIRELTLTEYQPPNASRIINKYVFTSPNFIDIFLMQLLIPKETYVLRIRYDFQLNEKPIGFFRSKYINKGTNETRWIAVSNFSPDYARRAFPCFDEPWIKTPFRISIGRRSEMRSHSNSMRRFTEEIRNMPGYEWDHYEKTLPMSTYVVAFMVTDFSSYDVDVMDRPSHTIFAKKEILKSTEYVGRLVPRILRSLENLTGFYYEPDKLDVIIVPSLAYSAMENWGLITIREAHAIIANGSDTMDRKREFAAIVAHEVAHQWFGNLVTPKWWSDVWLKEGFSSFFGNLALSIIEPSWTLENTYAVEYSGMFESSGAENAHPLHITMNTIKRLDSVFDGTSYMKGNCVVYMMFHFLGKTTFLSSIRRYVQTYYYRSADQENVWNAFQEEIDLKKSLPSELNMSDVMRTWTDQAGFPILQVTRDRATGAVLLTQHRFYNRGLNGTSRELWYIPLTWTTGNDPGFINTLPKAWMHERRMEINDSSLNSAIFNEKWILFNVNLTGLYRVNYDAGNWKLLINSYKTLPQTTKAQLLSDSFAIARAGLLDHNIFWNLLQNLETETEETLWSTSMVALESVKHALWNSNSFKFLICKLASRVYSSEVASLTYNDPELWTRLKVGLFKWICSMGHKTCTTMARNLAGKILRNESYSSIPEDYRTGVYCAYVKVVTGEQWLTLLERYKNSERRDKGSLAYALGCHSNATLLRRYLALLSSENETQDKYMQLALASMVNNPHGLDIVVEYFPKYWTKLKERTTEFSNEHYPENSGLIDVLWAFSFYMDREENIEWLNRLKGANDDYDTIVEEVINRVEINVAWNKKHKSEILRMLNGIVEKYTESRDCAKTVDR